MEELGGGGVAAGEPAARPDGEGGAHAVSGPARVPVPAGEEDLEEEFFACKKKV